jgi:PKD repeat protein
MSLTFTLLGQARRATRLASRFSCLLALCVWGALPMAAQAQLALPSATPVPQNFDGIGTTATAVLPTGFKFSPDATPTYDSGNNYLATTIATTGNNFTTGGTYNFGSAAGAGASDRAVGFLNSGSYTSPRHILLQVQNTSGAVMQDLTVQFDIEKYRSGSRAYDFKFYVSTNGTTWVAQPTGDQSYPGDANNTVYTYPPLTTSKQVTLTGVAIAPNDVYYLRWSDVGVAGSSNSQGLALDNVVLIPTLAGDSTPPTGPAITTASLPVTSFCVTSTTGSPAFSVAFTSSGTLTGTYRAQLSNAAGVFPANATDNIIGSGAASPLTASLPAGTPSGSGYRVRVLNDAPLTPGTDNGQNLTVTQSPDNNTVTVSPAASQTLLTTATGSPLTTTATSPSTFAWYYGTSGAGPFTTAIAGATAATYAVKGADFGSAGTYYLVAQATTTTTCGALTGLSAPVMVTVTAPPVVLTPTLTVSVVTLPDFGSTASGAASPTKSFTVSGTNLTSPITLTPPAGFEIRTGAQAFACCPIELTPVGGAVSATIDVRFVPTAAQAYAATIAVSSPGVAASAVSVSGTGIAPVYPATVSTAALTSLAPTSATTGGTIDADGGSAVTARGVVWSKLATPTLVASKTVDGAGAGSFTSTLAGLLPGTTYFVRAYATSAAGTAYGEEFSFTTVAIPLAAEPTAQSTLTASAVTSTSLQLTLAGGTGAKHLVLARLTTAVDATPADATTYRADAAFGAGAQLGAGNYVVYAGTGSSLTVTGLRASSTYAFAVFDYNDNDTPYAENYLATAPGTLTQATPDAPAALLLEENFDYLAGTALTANNWTAHSGGVTNAIKVTASGLSYPGYSASGIGNAAAVTANGQDVSRSFAPVAPRTPVYVSYLVNVANATATGDYYFHLGPTSLGGDFRSRVFVRRGATASKLQFGISGSGTATYSATNYDVNTTYLVVVKYTFDENGNLAQLFVNPAGDNEPTASDASSTEAANTSPANIGTVALRQGSSSPNLMVDGLRVGNTYRVVKTGLVCLPPAPKFTAAPVCVGAPTAFTDASTTVEATATYAWDVDSDGKTDYTTKGAIAHTYPAAGTYTATLTITQGACSDVYAQAVVVRALPTATISGSPTVCAGSSATLSVRLTGVAPWTISYSADGGATATTSSVAAGDVTADGVYALVVHPAATKTYTLTAVTDGNCTGTALAGTATVTVNTAPVLTVPVMPIATTQAGLRGASVAFAATATGSTPAPVLTYSITQQGTSTPITSPYVFPVGTTSVTATATNSCGTTSQTFAVTVQNPSGVSVLYQNLDFLAGDNGIRPNLQLVNNSAAAIPYKELTVRYWLTVEDFAAVTAAVDWAQLGTSAVKTRYVALAQPAQGAFGYVEYSFTAASSLAAGGNSGSIQSRIYKQTQTTFNEVDDYSYAATRTYAKNERLTVYRNGVLIGGVEPALVAPVTALQVWSQNAGVLPLTNTLSTYLQLRNVGNQAVAYQDVAVRYWFSPESTAALKAFVDYAQLGSSNVSISFGKVGTETYAELRFAAALGSLAPLSTTGNVQYRLGKADWSLFNQTNDFSYRPFSLLLAENDHITVYQLGQLVYGQEPAGATTATSAQLAATLAAPALTLAPEDAPTALPAPLSSYPNPFTGSTTLTFVLAQSQQYQLEIYDISGRLLQRLQAGQATAGQQVQVEWAAATVPAGFYLARLTTGTTAQNLKLVRQ